MKKNYKKLLFDLDNTLIDDNENRKFAIEQILIERGEDYTPESLENFIEIDNNFWRDRAAGKVPDPYKFKNNEEKTKWVRAQRFIRYFDGIGFGEASLINDKYMEFLKKKVVPINGATEIVEYLYDKGYEIFIITNGPTVAVEDKLKGIGALEYVKEIFSADEAGHMKPNPVFFNKFFEKIGCSNKSEMLIIGDELEKDVAGGFRNGIDTCWFNRFCEKNDVYTINYEIKKLEELRNIL